MRAGQGLELRGSPREWDDPPCHDDSIGRKRLAALNLDREALSRGRDALYAKPLQLRDGSFLKPPSVFDEALERDRCGTVKPTLGVEMVECEVVSRTRNVGRLPP